MACVYINGANRLVSNSLPECLVFGAAAGKAAAEYAMRQSMPHLGNPLQGVAMEEETRVYDQVLKHEGGERISSIRSEMQSTMDESVGIYRDENGLSQRSEEHTSELQSRPHLVCRLLLEK